MYITCSKYMFDKRWYFEISVFEIPIVDCITIYSRLPLFRSRSDPLKHFEISVLRHIRFVALRKIPIELPNFTNEHVI